MFQEKSEVTSDLQDQNLGNWQLKRQVGTSAPIIFKFPVKFSLKAGQRVTVSSVLSVHDHTLTGCSRFSA